MVVANYEEAKHSPCDLKALDSQLICTSHLCVLNHNFLYSHSRWSKMNCVNDPETSDDLPKNSDEWWENDYGETKHNP